MIPVFLFYFLQVSPFGETCNWHQAIHVGFGNGGDVQPILLQKEVEIFLFPEHILEPIGLVENRIAGVGL
jgi:hypothetical protein